MSRRIALSAFLVAAGSFDAPRAPAPLQRPRAEFEVASIKPHSGGCGFGSLSFEKSPGRFAQCNSLSNFIQMAYVFAVQDANHQVHRKLRILGGPAWVGSFNDLYDITAKANGPAPSAQMSGPMLRALLEFRFTLKLHRETRQLPVYNLTVARGGTKLKPLKEWACSEVDSTRPPTGAREKCPAGFIDGNGQNTSVDVHGQSMTEFAELLSHFDRPVIEATGLKGLFDIRFKFAHTDSPDDSVGPPQSAWDGMIPYLMPGKGSSG